MLSIPDIEAGVQLSEEQQAVLKLVENGEVSLDLSRSPSFLRLDLPHHPVLLLEAEQRPHLSSQSVFFTGSAGKLVTSSSSRRISLQTSSFE